MAKAVNQMSRAQVDGWLCRLGRVICPPRCLVCREPGAEARDLCAACAAELPWNRHACPTCALPSPGVGAPPGAPASRCGACLQRPSPLAAAHAAFVYGFPLDRLLPRLKFHGDLAAGRLLSQLMADALVDVPRPDALLPVPLHGARLRRRGYDQALELARPLGRALGIPVIDRILRRQRATRQQSRLDAGQRQRNLRGAFALADPAALPAHVALVDDVMTTGATLHAAAAVLRRAGVARVDAWVCARAP
ncbi:ComF family protein [Luteimonas vadosa]|uniref:ComF family protein n=1 Tax=Luteimonas vadosa TaxID=1165507 RepID=A0ABP9DQ51_9GAMM